MKLKILVLSDSHGSFNSIYDITAKENPDLIIHLGDGAKEAEDLGFAMDIEVQGVCGNCDFRCNLPSERLIEVEGKRIFLCHGHTLRVKAGLSAAIAAARDCESDVLLYGHTHTPFCSLEPGMWVMNPGSSGFAMQYGIMTIERGEVTCRLCRG